MLRFRTGSSVQENKALLDELDFAAEFHDLGKLDDDIQSVLREGRGGRLKWDHMDAGIAWAQSEKRELAAWLVRAHHSPGLSSEPAEQIGFGYGPLRGRRKREGNQDSHREQVSRTDQCLETYLARHREACGTHAHSSPHQQVHGVALRLLLSCLVDADHTDTATWDGEKQAISPPPSDWNSIAKALDEYVGGLANGKSKKNRLRAAFYRGAIDAELPGGIATCEAGVGLGKTTSVTRYLLKHAQAEESRHLFIVAPYTNILRQTARTLRQALGFLCSDELLCENHHRAEFAHVSARQYSALWKAPITLTTAVQFFETLASNNPADLRKLHELPGSVIFIDETHAALPARMWPQAWSWIKTLADDWRCRVVFASGSMVRFWEQETVIKPTIQLPELTPANVLKENLKLEKIRVRIETVKGTAMNTAALTSRLAAHVEQECAEGPVLCILNTVQSAAAIACHLTERLHRFNPLEYRQQPALDERRVLHLSTALSPKDRETILEEIEARNKQQRRDWILVATSCVEAGVDLDFQTGYRERCSVASLIQTSGRVNRHNIRSGSVLYDFVTDDDGILSKHPAFKESAPIVERMWQGIIQPDAIPGDLVTTALRLELERTGGLAQEIAKAEAAHNYPEVARLFKIIQTDTRTVIVDKTVADRVRVGDPVASSELLMNSVQLWADRIDKLGMVPIHPNSDIYVWDSGLYDPVMLGVMRGILPLLNAQHGNALIVDNVQ